ncbi:MAG TPA: tryptophan--tRNA ligase [Gemmatimonadales bacterium]|nr:tryptophan--tRNA ligase [Gemmatimonadales bacterium]
MTRVFSGIQPTGEIHLGNYIGALRRFVLAQNQDDCVFCIVDLHGITQELPDADELRAKTLDLAAVYLAAGIDPHSSTLFVQSHVSEHAELAWILNCFTAYGELRRMTQFKDKSAKLGDGLVSAGLFDYPVLMAADILLYRADLVPVGEDQVQHLELTREICRKWNAEFGGGEDYFPEPQPLLTEAKRILGLDGEAKMSKSLGNTIGILDSPAEVWNKLRPAKTDPARVTRQDPGNPEVCNIYSLHKYFSPAATVVTVATNCRSAGWGCIDCKKVLAEHLNAALEPIRERAAAYQAAPDRVVQILGDGAARARRIARETMAEVRERMGFLAARDS